ncbi:uncharacterized protein LOC103988330 [Musa acuminata AAA Group]|uniref:uncharacterized protein LOC103988330 n=1 Tax=Musa acuminata AAA Group TaxID=214697 RepID=UPI0031DE53A1
MEAGGVEKPESHADVEDPICKLTLALGESSSFPCPFSIAPASPAPVQSFGRTRPAPAPKGRDKTSIIPPPFPWATPRRATVHTLSHLRAIGIAEIHGETQCKHCKVSRVIRYDLEAKFEEVAGFIMARKHLMHDRAPPAWMHPTFPHCEACGLPNSMQPIVAAKKRDINWLFMLLGQTLGCCNLRRLKYFCKHTENHRTGAKDRLLYLTYLTLCKQLHPSLPF